MNYLNLSSSSNQPSRKHKFSQSTPQETPEQFCLNLSHCLIEVLAGARNLEQLARWVSDGMYSHLVKQKMISERFRVMNPSVVRPRVVLGKPHLQYFNETIIDAVVLAHEDERTRAITLRLEFTNNRWVATTIGIL